MRETGPIRKQGVTSTDVDPDAQAAYVGIARNYLGIVKNQARLGNLQQLARTFTLPDGTTIRVATRFGQDTVEITVPPTPTIEQPEVIELVFEPPEPPVDVYTPPTQSVLVICSGSVTGPFGAGFEAIFRPIKINGKLIVEANKTLISIDERIGGALIEHIPPTLGTDPGTVLLALADPTASIVLPMAQQPTKFDLYTAAGELISPTIFRPTAALAPQLILPPLTTGTLPLNMGDVSVPRVTVDGHFRIVATSPLGEFTGIINTKKSAFAGWQGIIGGAETPYASADAGIVFNVSDHGAAGQEQGGLRGNMFNDVAGGLLTSDAFTATWSQTGGNYSPAFNAGANGVWSLDGNVQPSMVNTVQGVVTVKDAIGGLRSISVDASWDLT